MRAEKYVACGGLYSRKQVKEFFRKKRITIDDEIVTDGSVSIDETKNIVKLDGERVIYKPFVYLIMNKPAGYISATEDIKEKTVIDILPQQYLHFNPFPVGRLDKDTVGLLILTNDGDLAHKLLSPKKHVAKKYRATTLNEVTEKDILAFQNGIYIKEDDYTTMPGDLKILENEKKFLSEVTIYEGKFHQVKRMFAARGNKVLFLERIEFAGIPLPDDLDRGKTRELTSDELLSLFNIGGNKDEK